MTVPAAEPTRYHALLTRLGLLRGRLLAAVLVTAVLGLVGTYWLFAALEASEERASVLHHARSTAHAIAPLVAGALDAPAELATICRSAQAGLGDEQLIAVADGRTVCSHPVPRATRVVRVTVSVDGATVTVLGDLESTSSVTAELTAVVAALLVLVVAVALLVSRRVVHEIREPISRAVDVADRVAAGDLTARMGPTPLEDLAHLSRAFDGMASRLEEGDRLQRQFLADLAHEIATPLNVVSGYATALTDGTVDTDEARAEAAAAIAVETSRVQGLLDDLRRLHRLDWAEPVRAEWVDVAGVCRELAARLHAMAESSSIELAVNGRRLRCWCDRRLVESVLINLLTNAIRYTPSGGRVTMTVRRRGRWVVVAVRDTGIGIAPEHRDRIFDRLYRVDEARDRATGGSGLGLAIAQRAAVALGGRIEVDSAPGRGSEFTLVLPERRGTLAAFPQEVGTAR